jgi:hypothetical protein
MVHVNHAGTSQQNPVLSGVHFRINYYKHDENEALQSMWIEANDATFSTLTARCEEEDYRIYCDVEAGVDLLTGDPAVLNIINIITNYTVPRDTTESYITIDIVKQIHTKAAIFIANVPRNFILIDGYNADDPNTPAVFRPLA